MNSKMLLLSIGMTLWSTSHAFELITAEEAAQNARPPEGYTLRQAAPTEPPRIVVDQPKRRDLKNPIDIVIRFIPETGTQANPDSLKILYGWMGIDITERIRNQARITTQGITAHGAELPTGDHTLTIQVADSKQRVGQTELTFSVR